jgi:6-pyruvoyltetrahydropterin/6-carboxytetrahydropterin synthase
MKNIYGSRQVFSLPPASSRFGRFVKLSGAPDRIGGKMFYLSKEFTFEASHQLPNHDGKCARLHGHSWRMLVTIEGRTLQPAMRHNEVRIGQTEMERNPKAGMLMDYADIKAIVKPFVDEFLDHWHLNDSTGIRNPTSESLAVWVFNKLVAAFQSQECQLKSITIYETCTSSCTYQPDIIDNIDRQFNYEPKEKAA